MMPACRNCPEPPHTDPMAGSPLKRARKQGIPLDDGTIMAFLLMPRRADLPPGWRRFSHTDKIKHLLGMSLDRVLEIISWDWTGLDPMRLSLRATPAVPGQLCSH